MAAGNGNDGSVTELEAHIVTAEKVHQTKVTRWTSDGAPSCLVLLTFLGSSWGPNRIVLCC